MRFLLILVLLVLSAAAGWVFGSLHPAPESILAPIQNVIAGDGATSNEPSQTIDPVDEGRSRETEEPSVPVDNPEPALDPIEAPTSFASRDAALEQYRLWIADARTAHPYPESEERMYDVMMCESGGKSDIVNPAGPYTGLFQYVEGTWNGDWNTYRDADIRDARAQIFATALAWSIGMQSHWGCYSRTP